MGTRKPSIRGGGKRKNRSNRKDHRQHDAFMRKMARAETSDADQILILEYRSGNSVKEKIRLLNRISR